MNNRVPLPAGTTLGKSFEHGLDVNLGTYDNPDWQPFRRISGWAPTFARVTSDVTTYDDQGDTNEDVTGRTFSAAFTAQGNRSAVTGKLLRELDRTIRASRAKGEEAILDVRFYHKPEVGTPDPDDAGRAFVTVEATRQNTGNSESEVYSITLSGKGPYEPIENPFTGWGATAPVISTVTPEGAAANDLVTITGTGFSGATKVTIGGGSTSVEYSVISPSTIVAVVPTGTAGNTPVVVTTPGGASAAYTFVRGA